MRRKDADSAALRAWPSERVNTERGPRESSHELAKEDEPRGPAFGLILCAGNPSLRPCGDTRHPPEATIPPPTGCGNIRPQCAMRGIGELSRPRKPVEIPGCRRSRARLGQRCPWHPPLAGKRGRSPSVRPLPRALSPSPQPRSSGHRAAWGRGKLCPGGRKATGLSPCDLVRVGKKAFTAGDSKRIRSGTKPTDSFPGYCKTRGNLSARSRGAAIRGPKQRGERTQEIFPREGQPGGSACPREARVARARVHHPVLLTDRLIAANE